MEFHEKLQELRKKKGLTQEELAENLYVSRTAISKWESGRGWPSLESLKEISGFFQVSIDDLLSGDDLLSLAEKEKRLSIQMVKERLFGMVDICSILLILLPLYPNLVDGYVYSVNLLAYKEATLLRLIIYWSLNLALVMMGTLKLILEKSEVGKSENSKLEFGKGMKVFTVVSLLISIILVLVLAMSREAYAIVLAFLLLVIKTILVIK